MEGPLTPFIERMVNPTEFCDMRLLVPKELHNSTAILLTFHFAINGLQYPEVLRDSLQHKLDFHPSAWEIFF